MAETALVLLVLVVLQVFQERRHSAALAAEKDRVNDLLRLLEAKVAPAETAAYVAPMSAPEPEGTWLWSEDGLAGVLLDEES